MELNPCELGTKKFWDETYQTEIKNYNSFGDVGKIRHKNIEMQKIKQCLFIR